jgi:aldehyde:ferredoxin oxidoreductase
MYGYFNKLLRINLTQKSFTYENIPDTVLEKTLGGKGLGVSLLLKENPSFRRSGSSISW